MGNNETDGSEKVITKYLPGTLSTCSTRSAPKTRRSAEMSTQGKHPGRAAGSTLPLLLLQDVLPHAAPGWLRARQVTRQATTTFADVAGVDEVEELYEMTSLQNPSSTALGAKIPKACVLRPCREPVKMR